MNARAIELLGDRRGSHFTTTIAPEAKPAARVAFAKKILGTARTTDFESVEVLRTGEHVRVEIQFRRRPARQPPPPDLTPRQYEVLRLLARGSSTVQIAESLGLSRETVRNHIRAVLSALRVNSRIGPLVEGRRRGLID
jgi:DNA-binding CsgD family transcriptional regulator